ASPGSEAGGHVPRVAGTPRPMKPGHVGAVAAVLAVGAIALQTCGHDTVARVPAPATPAEIRTSHDRERSDAPSESSTSPGTGARASAAARSVPVVVGVVAAEDGASISGAEVVLHEDARRRRRTEHRGRTEADGRARFTTSASFLSVQASAPGRV